MEMHTRHKEDVKWHVLQDGYLGFSISCDFDPKNSKNIFYVLNEWKWP